MHAISKFLAMGLGAASVLLGPAVNAQSQSTSPPPSTTAPGSAAKPDLSDKKLDAVAAAVKDVSTVSDTYKKKLAQAPDSEKEKILDQADEAAMKAVTDKGLSVEEYMSIMKVAENDSTVRDKLIARLK